MTAPVTAVAPTLADNCVLQLGDKHLDMHASRLIKVAELWRGAYGVVDKIRLPDCQFELAVKRIRLSVDSEEYKRFLFDVRKAAQTADCAFMVRSYGCMHRDGEIWICMEAMDKSLDQLCRRCVDKGIALPERFLARTAFAVATALSFMAETLGMVHRSVRPSKILVNRCGQLKLCDFGIRGHPYSSVAMTLQTACKPYMPPECVEGTTTDEYDVRSDVWRLGITIVEVATGKHPYSRWETPFEQLKQLVNGAAPTLPDDGRFSPAFRHFAKQCLLKDVHLRPEYDELLRGEFLVLGEAVTDDEVGGLVCQLLSVRAADTQCGE